MFAFFKLRYSNCRYVNFIKVLHITKKFEKCRRSYKIQTHNLQLERVSFSGANMFIILTSSQCLFIINKAIGFSIQLIFNHLQFPLYESVAPSFCRMLYFLTPVPFFLFIFAAVLICLWNPTQMVSYCQFGKVVPSFQRVTPF